MDLCDSSIKPQEARPLYSPTTPIIEPQIETATASQILPFLYLGKFGYMEIYVDAINCRGVPNLFHPASNCSIIYMKIISGDYLESI